MIEQFRGYGSLKDLDWEAYRERYDDLGRLDWILEAEGSSVLEYQVSKQPDAVMLFYLFSRAELEQTFDVQPTVECGHELVGADQARLFFTGTNLLLLHDNLGDWEFDPEANNIRSYPIMRTLSLGLDVSL